MVKHSHHPSREEMKRLRERLDREEEEIPLKPFDTTLTSGINDTVRQLRILREDGGDPEEDRLQFDAIKQLTAESRMQREALAGIIDTLNMKASKRLMNVELEKYTAKFDKRVDNIFKLVAALGAIIAALVSVIGIVIALRAH